MQLYQVRSKGADSLNILHLSIFSLSVLFQKILHNLWRIMLCTLSLALPWLSRPMK